ncbi:MAG: hypothetical protein IK076_00565, partial [Bacteroidales bacterium]|nr:hypothetical protein [Bacteroidales bacterium]
MKKFLPVLCSLGMLLLAACSGDRVSDSIPLPEHPRPDFERSQWMNLNGHWAFTFDEALATKA